MKASLSTMSAVVSTSAGGGHSPETIAELCVNKIISVSDTAPPAIQMQARAYREQMLRAVREYVIMAMQEDRASVVAELRRIGQTELAEHIKGL